MEAKRIEAVTTKPKRKYLHEIDLMRIIFTFDVLFNHTLNVFASAMSKSGTEYQLLRTVRVMFHFSRMGFLFVSGVVLTMIYYKKHDWPVFLKKRFNGSIWPYLIWNGLLMVLTVIAGTASYTTSGFVYQYFNFVIHGSFAYLYYMLLVMQLYLLFPVIIALFHRFERHQEWLLAASFLMQLVFTALIKYVFWNMDQSSWPYWFKAYSINIFSYQFYVILGAYVSLHYQQVYALINRHISAIAAITIVLMVGTMPYFRVFDQQILHLSVNHATALHQPYIAMFNAFAIVLVFWIGKQYANYRARGGVRPWLRRAISNVAKVSFGIYLCQEFGLILLRLILQAVAIPDAVLIWFLPLGWVFIIAVSFGVAWFFYKVPPFGLLVGRPNAARIRVGRKVRVRS